MSKNYETELANLMRQFAPSGGFGIPNIGGLANQYQRQSEQGWRSAMGQENRAFDRMGLGSSVAKAFSPGTRKIQFNQDLLDALTQLYSKHGQLAESQRQNLMGMMSPIAWERANQPSWLSQLAGGVLGMGAQVAMPWLGAKAFGGNQLEKMLMQMFGGGGQGQGMATPQNFNFGYNSYQG